MSKEEAHLHLKHNSPNLWIHWYCTKIFSIKFCVREDKMWSVVIHIHNIDFNLQIKNNFIRCCLSILIKAIWSKIYVLCKIYINLQPYKMHKNIQSLHSYIQRLQCWCLGSKYMVYIYAFSCFHPWWKMQLRIFFSLKHSTIIQYMLALYIILHISSKLNINVYIIHRSK